MFVWPCLRRAMSPRGGSMEMFRVAFPLPPPSLWPCLQQHAGAPCSQRQPTAVPLMRREPHPPICARGVPTLPSVCFSAVEASLWLLHGEVSRYRPHEQSHATLALSAYTSNNNSVPKLTERPRQKTQLHLERGKRQGGILTMLS